MQIKVGYGTLLIFDELFIFRMNPSMALAVRARAVELCRMPSLTILLTLEHAQNNPESKMTKHTSIFLFWVLVILRILMFFSTGYS
jgi:Integrator complex subunit 2